MARYRGSVCRLCRREGQKLFLKGVRCYTEKCAIEKRPYPPGQAGQGRKKTSEYGLQLREKQKARRIYGLLEKQFRGYYYEASRTKGVTGEVLLQLLERRLDNVIYRMGFAASRAEARMLVRQGHVLVNGKRVDIPSFRVSVEQIIQVSEKMLQNGRILAALAGSQTRESVNWLEVDVKALAGTVKSIPEREDVGVPVQEQLIVEFYSK